MKQHLDFNRFNFKPNYRTIAAFEIDLPINTDHVSQHQVLITSVLSTSVNSPTVKSQVFQRSVQLNQTFEIIFEILTVGELADVLEISATEVIKTLMPAGTMVSINQEIDFETAASGCG